MFVTMCYPQTLLEECKCEIKKNKMENLINDDFDSNSSDESESEPDRSLAHYYNAFIVDLKIRVTFLIFDYSNMKV